VSDYISLLSDYSASLHGGRLQGVAGDNLLLSEVSGLLVSNQGGLDVVEGTLDLGS